MMPTWQARTAARRGMLTTRRLNGGLNYDAPFALVGSELRDGNDIDLFDSGAIGSRRALQPFWSCPLPQAVKTSYAWEDNFNHDHMLVVLNDGTVKISTDGSGCFTDSVFPQLSGLCTPHFWSAGGFLYLSDGAKVYEWGGGPTAGGVTYPLNDVTVNTVHPMSATPQVTNMGVPPNCAAATYRDVVFVGNTKVKDHDPDAVWWSAAVAEQPTGQPTEGQLTGQKDYYENQRITFISGAQGDYINALVAAGPALYAFKRRSVHVLSTSGSTVYSNDLSTEVGLAGPNAYAVQGTRVWFFDAHKGLHAVDGASAPVSVFGPIFPLLDCGRVTNPERVAVGFDGDKVFVSLTLDGASTNNTTFVLNTKLQGTAAGGAWSRWNVGFDSFTRWNPIAGDSTLVGFTCWPVRAAVKVNECSDEIFDDYGFTKIRIRPWFRTAFMDDGLPMVGKNWGNPHFTISSSGTVSWLVDAYTMGSTYYGDSNERCEEPARGVQLTFSNPDLAVLTAGFAGLNACFDDCIHLSERVCVKDSRRTSDRFATICENRIARGEQFVRVAADRRPGRGITTAFDVFDNGSTKAWKTFELDIKYTVIQEGCL